MYIVVTISAAPRTTGITTTGEQFYENTKKYTSLTQVTDKTAYKLMHYCIDYYPTYLKVS